MFNSLINVEFKENYIIIAEFQNGDIKELDLKQYFEKYPIFLKLTLEDNLFQNGKIAPGGCGIIFNDEIDIAAEEIFQKGKLIKQRNIDDVLLKIANQVSEARELKGITQTQLSKITGIHQAEISKIERGIGNPSIKTLERIAKGLGLNLELFIK